MVVGSGAEGGGWADVAAVLAALLSSAGWDSAAAEALRWDWGGADMAKEKREGSEREEGGKVGRYRER